MNSQKQQIHLITYATNRFKTRADYFNNIVSKYDQFSTVKVYSNLDITKEFAEKYHDVLNMPRGGGYWLWKVDIIMQSLQRINDNDILIYCDAGCHVNLNDKTIQNFNKYLNLVNMHEMLRFELGHKEYCFTNKATLKYFKENYNLQKEDVFSNMLMATVILMKKNKEVIKFFEEFLKIISKDRYLITDYYNSEKYQGFVDHRHDQSILSLLTKTLKMGHIIPDETWYDDWNKTDYSPFVASRCMV
jgi:hypothetical protein